MPDLNRDQVHALLRVLGLDVGDPELTEVTHRVNALIEGLLQLDKFGITRLEPSPVLPPRGE